MENRKTKVPITHIRKLIKMKKEFDDEVRNTMAKYNVDMAYMRGLLKEPSKELIHKKITPTPTKKQKKYIDRSDLIE